MPVCQLVLSTFPPRVRIRAPLLFVRKEASSRGWRCGDAPSAAAPTPPALPETSLVPTSMVRATVRWRAGDSRRATRRRVDVPLPRPSPLTRHPLVLTLDQIHFWHFSLSTHAEAYRARRLAQPTSVPSSADSSPFARSSACRTARPLLDATGWVGVTRPVFYQAVLGLSSACNPLAVARRLWLLIPSDVVATGTAEEGARCRQAPSSQDGSHGCCRRSHRSRERTREREPSWRMDHPDSEPK